MGDSPPGRFGNFPLREGLPAARPKLPPLVVPKVVPPSCAAGASGSRAPQHASPPGRSAGAGDTQAPDGEQPEQHPLELCIEMLVV